MESSEDDAGIATSASRRASAREKDVGLAEDVDAARNFQHESSETRASCGTPAMSEDNFDGDSVPSPSSKETSTEAILDMIDDFIGDPRAPRLPLPAAERIATPPVPSTSGTKHNKQSEESSEKITTPPRVPSPAPVAHIETLTESVHAQPAEEECTPQSEILICVNINTDEVSPRASSSLQVYSNENCSNQHPENSENVIAEVSTEGPVMVPLSSSIETVKVTSDTGECDSLGRTVKCVTSSESRDNVTVELAESTSSECSVSESKALSMELTVCRSPLKRRLVRPAPSDRRPDSTVSSTADSHTDIHIVAQTTDIIAKDVSSSSDAVPIQGITKLEEISNVSEISICKAETSSASSRKIKLVRPKVIPVMSNSVTTDTQTTTMTLDRDRCQSTSSDEISTPLVADVETSSSTTIEKFEEEINRPMLDNATLGNQPTDTPETSKIAMSNSEAVTTNDEDKEVPQISPLAEPSLPNTISVPMIPSHVSETSDEHMDNLNNPNRSNVTQVETKALPMDSNLRETETAMDITEECSSTHLEETKKFQDKSNPSSPLVVQDLSQTSLINCEQNQPLLDPKNSCTISKTEKKVPPMKINLTNIDNSKNIEKPIVDKKSQTFEGESTSSKVEDSTKQVPKLTIKLSNKHSEEVKSPVPKLTIKPLRPPVEQILEDHVNQQVPTVTKLNIKPLTKPMDKPTESVLKSTHSSDNPEYSEQIPNITKVNIKPIAKLTVNVNEIDSMPMQSFCGHDTDTSKISKSIPSITKINIKPIPKLEETPCKNTIQSTPQILEEKTVNFESNKPTSNIMKLNIKPISKPTENINESLSKCVQPAEQSFSDLDAQQIPSVTKINIKPILKPTEIVNDTTSRILRSTTEQNTEDVENIKQVSNLTKLNIKPIPKPTENKKESVSKQSQPSSEQDNIEDRQIPNVTKLNIKPIPKPSEMVNENASKSLMSAVDLKPEIQDSKQLISNITKINIKPIAKPSEIEHESRLKTLQTDVKQNDEGQESTSITKINLKPKVNKNVNDNTSKPGEIVQNDVTKKNEQIPVITKLNIKPIVKPPDKVNEIHRKSSSSEISESEYSENDESTSNSDQTSTSDQGHLDSVPKVTIKLGKPGTESEGKFYTEKNIPKLTIKNVQQSDKDDQEVKTTLVISQAADNQQDKVPKITIKTVAKSESQPLSPKLTIKPIKPPENINKEEIPKLKISTDSISSSSDVKENVHVPKITIKPVTKSDGDAITKTPKKSAAVYDSSDHIPMVTKLNIKPILKPTESGESSDCHDEKVPVVSKLNIKPVLKPKDNEVDSSIEEVPKLTKLNIKPIKNPEDSSSDKKDCDEMNADMKDSCIPVVTKLNIKPIVKPVEDEALKDSENQSSETGNSSDENVDHIPIVTKLNIKPIVKPSESEEPLKSVHSDQGIPVVTKLNIKPLLKPEEQSKSPGSPKKECLRSPGSTGVPVLTKLNIKPIVKPDDTHSKAQEETAEKCSKPPLLMKINMKNVAESKLENEHLSNNISGKAHSPKMAHSPKSSRRAVILEKNEQQQQKKELTPKPTNAICDDVIKNSESNRSSPSLLQSDCSSSMGTSNNVNLVPEKAPKTVDNSTPQSAKHVATGEKVHEHPIQEPKTKSELIADNKTSKRNAIHIADLNDKTTKISEHYNTNYSKTSVLNCTLLKQLLSTTKEIEKPPEIIPSNCLSQSVKSDPSLSNCKESKTEEGQSELLKRLSPKHEIENDSRKHSADSGKMRPIEDIHREANESVTKPLEIITDKIANQSSGQDSPRIILKINKTDQGASAKIITDETYKSTDSPPINDSHESIPSLETVNDSPSPKKHLNSRRKTANSELAANVTLGKRLRSSRIVETPEKSPVGKRNVNKRPLTTESPGPLQQKESEISMFDTKRMKLEQLLSVNKSLTITPVVSKVAQISPSKSSITLNQGGKISHNHSLLNNENSQKNGNSKLQNILSNLQAKQMQTLQLNDTTVTEKSKEATPEVESSTSTASSDVVVEITRVDNCHLEVQEMMINENSVCDLTGPEDVSQDPLEVEGTKSSPEKPKEVVATPAVEVTPTPRKRGRPRKLPLPDSAKPATPAPLPVPALEERPQRSLRLMREKPPIIRKPRGRGRGRGRGGRRAASPVAPSPEPEPAADPEPEPETVVVMEVEERAPSPIDPTSSRIKLPRMTEALDKSVAGASCATPLSSRRRSSEQDLKPADLKLFGSTGMETPGKGEEFMKSPEATRPRSGRGSRGGKMRTPRGRGRGRGGGRGAVYMKETMGIYGRVCGPATTTVQLFEEETCMMDDNATPSKPSHLLDEDSQSSVKSSTNDSNKMKKSKFIYYDPFDSNKIWTAADVKEYTWPPPDTPNAEPQVMMIQEQVAMFLGVKSFKRRYPELKRRPIGGAERDYVLSKELVSEALCDLGVMAVDASEILDIMLSDYPHKYEEYRAHQRQRQAEETVEVKVEEKPVKVEIKSEKTSDKPEPPKVDPEKTRQDMAAAAIASAAEWNARANAWRRPACVDLQSNTIHRRRPAPSAPPVIRVRPPGGFYPHALLPGQFQHWYRSYTAEQLRYFPLNTAMAAPPAPPSPADSSSESEGSWGERSSSSDDEDTHHAAKRKKLSRKRSSQPEPEEAAGEPETCRTCKLRLEANRKHTHERFLVCARCNAKLHPACVALPADTIRKCRSYAWQCAECKSCCACQRPQDDDKMLFCDLCDRGFHIYCVGLTAVPSGRWHCVECAICKSCGARDPNGLNPGTPGLSTPGPSTPGALTPGPSTPGVSTGPGEWHHQTRRGPGGHKVYSHSLCTPCARAYRIGRYCPLCERSFIGPKGTMQLVICKLCDRQLHQECVRQTVSTLRVLDYTCGECRRGGITSRAAAVRAAPRTIATLFMAKRRFNKYAHRQYLASRLQALQDADPTPTDEETSGDLADPLEGVGLDPSPPDD